MRDKVVLGITLAVILLLTLGIYGIVDTQRGPSEALAARAKSADNGKRLYATYCIQCHGPQGEGCIGPALNRAAWRPENNGVVNTEYDAGTGHDFIVKTVSRGRISNQPGIQMPAWSTSENGPLTDQEIEDITTFILYGDWNTVLENAVSASNLSDPLPSYTGFEDPQKLDQVKQLMLSKGCLNCHAMGKGGGQVAAPLTDVGSRRTAEWIKQWVHDPKAMPANQRGPNLWLIAPTPSLETPGPNAPPTATPIAFPMNTTYMPTIPMTDAELNLLVDYLSHAKVATK
jgi:mono/diheme cytochrome c family protein